MFITKCAQCSSPLRLYPSRAKKATIHFCNKSCHRVYKNIKNNPSHGRDLSGVNNPMYGKHPKAWNKGLKGESSHNWKGGIHTRNDGYVRINVNGQRYLYHRYLLKDQLKGKQVVHHKDHNPCNNDLSNLQILNSQSEHAALHANL